MSSSGACANVGTAVAVGKSGTSTLVTCELCASARPPYAFSIKF